VPLGYWLLPVHVLNGQWGFDAAGHHALHC
jgi:hypothetical protein